MAYKIPSVADLESYHTIKSIPGFSGVVEEEETTHIKLAFRQATEMEDRKRESFVSVPITRTWADDSDFAKEQYQLKPIGERKAYEVYLTLSACDIEGQDDKPIFKFSEVDGLRRVAGSHEEFLKKWGRMPKAVATAIHLKCIEANPTWGFMWASTTSDDDNAGE